MSGWVARCPELARPGPQRLVVLASEVGGRWGSVAHDLLRRLVRVRFSASSPAASCRYGRLAAPRVGVPELRASSAR